MSDEPITTTSTSADTVPSGSLSETTFKSYSNVIVLLLAALVIFNMLHNIFNRIRSV